jgi:RNA polymerase sigma factor (sigma-70 family)
MFYEAKRQPPQLGSKEIDRVRRGFMTILRRRGFSAQFIADNYEELLAIAQTEYVRSLAKGTAIENPVSWMLSCAWSRTQNLLRDNARLPQMVSLDRVAELPDEQAPDLSQDLDDTHQRRTERIQQAIEALELEERTVIALTYFEGMTCREAARALHSSRSAISRRRISALQSIHDFLGVERSDQLQLEIGIAAWIALGGTLAAPHPQGAMDLAHRAADGAGGLLLRAQELVRRLIGFGGTDVANAALSSGVGRAATVCGAAVAAVCFAGASGVIGPAIGGNLGQARPVAHPRLERPHSQQSAAANRPPAVEAPPASIEAPKDLAPQRDTKLKKAQPRRDARPSEPSPTLSEAQFGAEVGGAGSPVPTPRPETPSPEPATDPGSPSGGYSAGQSGSAEFGV